MFNILIIGPYAPHGQVGAIRVISLSKHLLERGHHVTVLCLSKSALKSLAPGELCAEVPQGVETVEYDLCQGGSSLLVKGMRQSRQFNRELKRLLTERQFDVALISGGPFYTFPASSLLRKHDIPYVVDYRDLHVSCREKRRRGNLLSSIKYWLTFPVRVWQEWPCVRCADAVTVVHSQMKENICSFFHVDSEKVHVCLNGFDEKALEGILLNRRTFPANGSAGSSHFTVGYFGKLMYYDRDFTRNFFQAVSQLRGEGLDIRMKHIGPASSEIERLLAVNEYDLVSWYTCTGLMDYRSGMEALSHCDAFYLEYAAPEGPGTKIFDYVYINKPVVAMVKKGITLESFLGRFQGAYVCHSQEDIAAALRDVAEGGRKFLLDDRERMQYSRLIQNDKFEKILSQAAERNVGR